MQDEINIKPKKIFENLRKTSVALNVVALVFVTPVLFMLQYSALRLLSNGFSPLSSPSCVEEMFIWVVTIAVMLLPLGLIAKISSYLIKIYLLNERLAKVIKADKVLTIVYLLIFCIVYYSFYMQYVFSSYLGV